ncbi:MAG TPA: alpha/beta hydrolase [Pseudonocardiaceae bacterium]|jgi:pimeloyl-ACP methyl ester carboxylesterase|nr:alpha/beta hydrolase [Pseudonocardiaceae bacterium]
MSNGLDAGVVGKAATLAAQDGEFRLVAAGWTGALAVVTDGAAWRVPLVEGVARAAEPVAAETLVPADDIIVLTATAGSWRDFLAAVPKPPYSDLFGAQRGQVLTVAPLIVDAARHNAVRRFGWLLRDAALGPQPPARPVRHGEHGEHDEAVGRYVHLDLDGVHHRLYYEQAGSGIPLLCHHTAASDARQWRHLLEDHRVTDRFRVIAYDLPFHGKSLPVGDHWWAEEYVLTRDRAMAIAVSLADALDLDRPVFVGSSIGGMLALDLARYHPDQFRGVIALQGGLRSSGGLDEEGMARMRRFRVAERLADPALAAARMMGMMAPTAPEASRQETMLHYAQAAPGVYAGDLFFHSIDHDLRGEAGAIDTGRCPVHLLTGEFDHTMVPITRRAADEIAGASLTIMPGLGHFPMSEDHEQLIRYLLPVLDSFVPAGS